MPTRKKSRKTKGFVFGFATYALGREQIKKERSEIELVLKLLNKYLEEISDRSTPKSGYDQYKVTEILSVNDGKNTLRLIYEPRYHPNQPVVVYRSAKAPAHREYESLLRVSILDKPSCKSLPDEDVHVCRTLIETFATKTCEYCPDLVSKIEVVYRAAKRAG